MILTWKLRFSYLQMLHNSIFANAFSFHFLSMGQLMEGNSGCITTEGCVEYCLRG